MAFSGYWMVEIQADSWFKWRILPPKDGNQAEFDPSLQQLQEAVGRPFGDTHTDGHMTKVVDCGSYLYICIYIYMHIFTYSIPAHLYICFELLVPTTVSVVELDRSFSYSYIVSLYTIHIQYKYIYIFI